MTTQLQLVLAENAQLEEELGDRHERHSETAATRARKTLTAADLGAAIAAGGAPPIDAAPDSKKEVDILKRKLSELNLQNEDQVRVIAQLQSSNAALSKKVNELTTDSEEMEDIVSELESELEEFRKQKQRPAVNPAEINSLKEQIALYEKDIDEMHELVTHESAEAALWKGRCKEADAAIEELRSRCVSLEKDNKTHVTVGTELEAENARLKETIDKVSHEDKALLNNLEIEISSLSLKAAEMQSKWQDSNRELEDQRAKVSSLTVENGKLTVTLKEATTKYDIVRTECDTVMAEKAALMLEMGSLKHTSDSLIKDSEASSLKLIETKSLLSALEVEYNAKRDKCNDLAREIAQLKAEKQASLVADGEITRRLREEIDGLLAARVTDAVNVELLQSQLAASQQKASDAASRVEALEAECSSAREQLRSSEQRAAAEEQARSARLEALEGERRACELQVKDLQSALSAEQHQTEALRAVSAEASVELADARALLAERDNQLGARSEELAAAKRELHAIYEERSTKEISRLSEIETLRSSLSETSTRLAAAEEELKTATHELAERRALTSDLQIRCDALSQDVAALRNDVLLANDKVAELTRDNDDLAEKAAEVVNAMEKLEEEFEVKKDKCTELMKENAVLKQRKSHPRGSEENPEEDEDLEKDQISELIDEIEDLSEVVAEQKRYIEEQNSFLETAAKDADSADRYISTLERKIESLNKYKARCKEMSQELQRTVAEKNSLIKQFTALNNLQKNIGLGAYGSMGAGGSDAGSVTPSNALFMDANQSFPPASAAAAAVVPPTPPPLKSMLSTTKSFYGNTPGSEVDSSRLTNGGLVTPVVNRLKSRDSFDSYTPGMGAAAAAAASSTGYTQEMQQVVKAEKKIAILSAKLKAQSSERRALSELLKLMLLESEQARRGGSTGDNAVDHSAAAFSKTWIEANSRKIGFQDVGYHDAEDATMDKDGDDDSDGELAAIKDDRVHNAESRAVIADTASIQHLILGWTVQKVSFDGS
jgi:chromosome segregation ATPase